MILEQNPTVDKMYTTLQNYTNMLVGKHGIQTFKVVLLLLLLLFDVFDPTSAYLLLFIKQVVCPNTPKCKLRLQFECLHAKGERVNHCIQSIYLIPPT